MSKLILFEAVKEKPFLTILAAVGIFFITPVIQSLTTSLAFKIWFTDLVQKPINSILYITFSVLFGMLVSLYLYTRDKCIDCKKDVKTGVIGTILGFMLGICPACFSLIGFLLPLGGILFLTAYSPLFIIIAIAAVLFSINKMRGFKDIHELKSELNREK